MPQNFKIIKKHSEFLNIKLKGTVHRSNSLILQKLFDEKLLDSKRLGYTATKKLGNAVRRNRAKRLMREIARKIINQYGKKNFSYVLIAKKQIFDTPIQKLENELRELVEKWKQYLILFLNNWQTYL